MQEHMLLPLTGLLWSVITGDIAISYLVSFKESQALETTDVL